MLQFDLVNLYLLIATIGIAWFLAFVWLHSRDKKDKTIQQLRQTVFEKEKEQLQERQDYQEQIRVLKAEHERLKTEMSAMKNGSEADKNYLGADKKFLTARVITSKIQVED